MLHLWKTFHKKFISDIKYHKVRDHCHYVVKYRDRAHSICNLKVNMPNEIKTEI